MQVQEPHRLAAELEHPVVAPPPRLARKVVLNLVGQGLPLVAGYAAIPALARALGADRFGILALAWAAVGYLSFFDLGLGRALTQLVASRLRRTGESELAGLARTALFAMTCLGFVAVAGGIAVTPALTDRVLRADGALRSEALMSFYLLSLSIPVVTLTASFRGLLEAKQRFDLVNVIRVPMGLFTFLGPLAALPFSRRLDVTVGVLVGGRVIFCAIHAVAVKSAFPLLRFRGPVHWSDLSALLSFGGWMTLSNVVGPLMVTLDRFLIAGLISTSAVAFYAAPYEALTKLWIFPGAVASVLFPVVAAQRPGATDGAASRIFARANKALFCVLFPLIVVIVGLAQPGLHAWLGGEYANRSVAVARWLAVGILVNSHAQLAFAFVQGVGRPDLAAKLHLVELPFYLFAAWWLIGHYGIAGAAAAWTLRCALDAGGLFWMAYTFNAGSSRQYRRAFATATLAAAALALALLEPNPVIKLLITTSLVVGSLAGIWGGLFTSSERRAARLGLRGVFGGSRISL